MTRFNLGLSERTDLSVPRTAPRMGARYDADAFGRFSEAIARFLGTGRFLFGQLPGGDRGGRRHREPGLMITVGPVISVGLVITVECSSL
jgi:hypothetical protein